MVSAVTTGNPFPPREPGNAHGLTCYHVNARVSKELEDIGEFHPSKLFLLLGYCAQAIWCRYRYGVTTLYYIPAPGQALCSISRLAGHVSLPAVL